MVLAVGWHVVPRVVCLVERDFTKARHFVGDDREAVVVAHYLRLVVAVVVVHLRQPAQRVSAFVGRMHTFEREGADLWEECLEQAG